MERVVGREGLKCHKIGTSMNFHFNVAKAARAAPEKSKVTNFWVRLVKGIVKWEYPSTKQQ